MACEINGINSNRMCPSSSLNNWGLCISSCVCWRLTLNEFQLYHTGANCELYMCMYCVFPNSRIAEHVLRVKVWGTINSVYTTGLPDITQWIIHLSFFCLCLPAVPIDSTACIKMLYVFVDIQMDNAHFLDTVKFNFPPGQSLALVSTIQFVAALQVIKHSACLILCLCERVHFCVGESWRRVILYLYL